MTLRLLLIMSGFISFAIMALPSYAEETKAPAATMEKAQPNLLKDIQFKVEKYN